MNPEMKPGWWLGVEEMRNKLIAGENVTADRQTGKTTALCCAAMELMRQGKKVGVLTVTSSMAEYTKARWKNLYGECKMPRITTEWDMLRGGGYILLADEAECIRNFNEIKSQFYAWVL